MAVTRESSLFRGTRQLEAQIDEFLDRISEAGIIFQGAIKLYLECGACREFEVAAQQVSELEDRGDELRRTIETQLYEQTLIPDLRADVLSLLENLDWLLNIFEAECRRFSIEAPMIPEELHKDFMDLTESVVTCVENVVIATRAFFRNIEAVRDHIHKVMFYESQADKIGEKLKRAIFTSELPLERKMHLRYFAEHVDEAANAAEDIADELAIYTIKRTI